MVLTEFIVKFGAFFFIFEYFAGHLHIFFVQKKFPTYESYACLLVFRSIAMQTIWMLSIALGH